MFDIDLYYMHLTVGDNYFTLYFYADSLHFTN